MSVEDAFARGELIEPTQFRARVLVWSTCYGVIDSGAPLDRQWSIVHQFNVNPQVDVVLAKWEGAFGHGPFLEMVRSLGAGASIGQVVAVFNATEGILERGAQFAILGDPRVAAPFRDVHPGLESFYPASGAVGHRSDGSQAAVPGDQHPADDLVALLQDCMAIPLRYSDEQQEAAAARERFEQAHAELRRDMASSLRLAELQSATLECFRRYTEVIRGWSPRVVAQQFFIGRRCAHCGELKTEAINVFASLWSPRRIGTCPRCQIVEDSPAEFDLDFRVTEDKQLELLGTIPGGRFSGILVLWSTTPIMGTVRSWPIGSDGRPLRRIDLDIEWPRATARVSVWMMFDLQYLMLNHRAPGTRKPSGQ
jgi:hypothetical protein